MPAHYSLLYFTKPGAKPKVNLATNKHIDSREYCLRGSCISKRKKNGNDRKEVLTDIWKDVHRIKHKKDRDQHPCQLPTKLMERIIKNFSDAGDLIFDPFGGSGTTAIAAKLLNRKYIITELDKKYVDIAEKNLNALTPTKTGEFQYQRKSLKKPKILGTPKKEFEKQYLDFAMNQNKALSQEDLKIVNKSLFYLSIEYKGDFNKIYAAARRRLESLSRNFA